VSTYQALPEDVLDIWICQQIASISTETTSESESRSKKMKQRVKNRHIFLEWYENVWGKED
jgi:hypothetical protein